MVFFFALTAKSAITAGLLIGGTVALYANKDRIAEFLENEWEKFTNERITMASNIKDGQFCDHTEEKHPKFSESEATTPEATDSEWIDDDLDSPVEVLDEKLIDPVQLFEKEVSDSFAESHMGVLIPCSDDEKTNTDIDEWGLSTAHSDELSKGLKQRRKLPADDISLYESSTDTEPWEQLLD